MTRSADWWRGCVIYQIYPRSFFDSNGDGIGDLPGILHKLDYVASLGVDAVWISPFFASPMRDYGYDVSDYRAVAPEFGTLEDFDRIIEKAHALGLKVLIDQVLSHTSDQHAWFRESRQDRTNPKADWYVWADPRPDGTPPNNWLSVFGGPAWQWEPRRRQYYLHNFLVSQPDLNFHNPAVVSQLLEEMEFWLRRGVDGFRLDAINFCIHDAELRDNPPLPGGPAEGNSVFGTPPYKYQLHLYDKTRPEALAVMQKVRGLLDRYPGSVALGELSTDDGRDLATMAAYTSGGDKLHMAYTFDFLGLRSSPAYLREVITETEAGLGDGWPCWAMSNHDVIRVATRWGKQLMDASAGSKLEAGNELENRLAALLMAFLCTIRGSACIYQGEELGLPEVEIPYEAVRDPFGLAMWPDYKGRDGCRTVMPWSANAPYAGFSTAEPWLPVDPPEAHRRRAVAEQEGRPGSVLERARRFLTWRRQHPALRQGSLELLYAPDEVIAFIRTYGGGSAQGQEAAAERLLVAFNLSARPARFAVPAGVSVSVLSGHGFEGAELTSGHVELPAFSAFFGRLSPPGA